MPYSSKEGKDVIREWFDTHEVGTVVDAGCGSGTYPKLLKDKDYYWIGIEKWAPYVEQFQLHDLYDEVHVMDICEYLSEIEATGDTLILGDVLEHMTKEDAQKTIKLADEKFQHVIISTPVNYEQGPTENPYEEHLSVWDMGELDSMIPASFTSRGISWDIAIFIK